MPDSFFAFFTTRFFVAALAAIFLMDVFPAPAFNRDW